MTTPTKKGSKKTATSERRKRNSHVNPNRQPETATGKKIQRLLRAASPHTPQVLRIQYLTGGLISTIGNTVRPQERNAS